MAQLIFTNGIAPATPGSGTVSLYTKTSDKKLYYKDDTGTEIGPLSAGGNSFSTIAVSGQSDVVADSTADTLSLVAGTNINITTNASTDTITITGTITGADSGFKNKIIGGNFSTNPWQRGTSFTAPATASYSADRWIYGFSSGGVVNILKTTDAPTATQAGLFTQHCLHIDVTTADVSIGAGEFAVIQHRIEGLNAASFGFGQSGTRSITLSFWHKHTKTGTHCVSFRNSGNDRSYVAEYTQDVSDTWEQAVVTLSVDTTGTWLYDTGMGLNVSFCLAAGSTFQTSANTWTTGSFLATANQVNNLDSTANNFKIALVQLEAGSTATAFEARSVGQELALCQRYYQSQATLQINAYQAAGNNYRIPIQLPVVMRASPTVSFTNTSLSNATGLTSFLPTAGGYSAQVTTTALGAMAALFDHQVSAEL
jgi:hypothetical protein